MNRPLVSILLVSHNAASYIAATIDSCRQQTYDTFELLILDNASTDATVSIIQATHDSRISLHRSVKNIGPYNGLNTLLALAQGKYIAIQDHDDLWLPTKLEQQVDFLENNPKFIAIGTRTYYYFEDRNVLVLPKNSAITNFVDHTSLMFQRGDWLYEPDRALPDEFFERRTLRQHGLIGCLQTGLTIHRVRADQKNLSTNRARWNYRGAWEHLRLTQYRDLLGAGLFLFSSWWPVGWRWWLRKNITLRKADWISKQEFNSKNPLKL